MTNKEKQQVEAFEHFLNQAFPDTKWEVRAVAAVPPEPKFKVGDVVTHKNGSVGQVKDVCWRMDHYIYTVGNYSMVPEENFTYRGFKFGDVVKCCNLIGVVFDTKTCGQHVITREGSHICIGKHETKLIAARDKALDEAEKENK